MLVRKLVSATAAIAAATTAAAIAAVTTAAAIAVVSATGVVSVRRGLPHYHHLDSISRRYWRILVLEFRGVASIKHSTDLVASLWKAGNEKGGGGEEEEECRADLRWLGWSNRTHLRHPYEAGPAITFYLVSFT